MLSVPFPEMFQQPAVALDDGIWRTALPAGDVAERFAVPVVAQQQFAVVLVQGAQCSRQPGQLLALDDVLKGGAGTLIEPFLRQRRALVPARAAQDVDHAL